MYLVLWEGTSVTRSRERETKNESYLETNLCGGVAVKSPMTGDNWALSKEEKSQLDP